MFEVSLPSLIVIVFGAVTFVELLYYYLIYARFSFTKKKAQKYLYQPPVSIVMVAKDAAGVLLKTLPKFLNQQYGDFEVVVVNDNSQDDTKMLVVEYQQQYSNLKLVELDTAVTTIRGEKFALSMGIRCASHPYLVLTNPEYAPTSTHWLEKMAGNFENDRQIVLGYSTFEKKKSPFNRLLHFDNLLNAVQYFSLAQIHSTYRGDVKNLGITQQIFAQQRGFASHNHIRYGEEDIFISKAANAKNTAIEFSQDAVTVLQRDARFNKWLDHKQGLYYTRRFNSLKNRLLLGVYALVNLLFYVGLAFAILFSIGNVLLLSVTGGIFALRILSQYLVFGFAAKKLNEKQVIPGLLLYDLLFAVLNPLYYIDALIRHDRFL